MRGSCHAELLPGTSVCPSVEALRRSLTGKLREADVIGCWRVTNGSHSVFAYLVVECKSRAKPWVVFDANDGLTGRPPDLLETLYTDEIPEAGRLGRSGGRPVRVV